MCMRGIMTFQAAIMFGLRFVRFWRPFQILLGYFYYERLIGILDFWILTSLLV